MNNRIFIIVMALSMLFLGACSTKTMLESPSGKINSPEVDKSLIVFMRSSFVASAIGVELFEIKNGKLKFVGELPNNSKIAHLTTPGEKAYMAYGVAADFMLAKVEQGKTYYSIVRPNWGTGAFIPTPVKTDGTTEFNTDSGEFEKWVNNTKLLVKKPDAHKWFQENKDKYIKIYEAYWEKFNNKNESQKQQRTLMPSDGM